MDTDKELENILDKIVKNLISRKKEEKTMSSQVVVKPLKPLKRVKIVDVKSPHGVYVYNKKDKLWDLVMVDGEAFKPWKDGYWIIYFDNTRCPACRIYDFSWYVYVETIGRTMDDTEFVIILCDWFARECKSEAAKKSFEEYDIHASPTTILMKVSNGKIEKMERVRGAKNLGELIEIINKFRK
ncbi:hypothetical protein J4526_08485 [Desulfurococcaceae archaeon MEX13E-LK6-19]|nr:hypothetical protein J4526_08485 [Desulfurococcaceae archaeon MEX13E-LK6-19]